MLKYPDTHRNLVPRLSRLSSVALRWFRGVREGVIEGLEDFTVLIGRNGVGKSTILEALYLASAWLEPVDPIRGVAKYSYVISRRGGRDGAARDVLWYMMDTGKDVSITLNANGEKAEFLLNYSANRLYLKLTEHLKNLLKQRLRGGERFDLVRLDDGRAALCSYPPRGEIFTGRDLVFSLLEEHMPSLLDILRSTVLIDSYLLSRPTLVEKYSWVKILSRRLDREVVRVLREEFEVDAEGLTYAPVGGSNVLMVQLRDTSVRVDDLGDGARLATLMMLTVLASRPRLLLVEEPETKMHPGGLRALTEALLRAAREAGSQVIATTHSLEFVKIGLEVAEQLGLGSALIHLERSRDGVLSVRRLSKPDADLLADLGIDPRFLHLF